MATNAITQQTAIDWITAWRANPDTKVKAFFIPKVDISNLLADSSCIGARGYLAWGTPDSSPAEAKLVLVSVDGDISKGGTDNIGNGIYDFTAPCPTTCDVNSPLYTLVADSARVPVGGNMISEATAINWITAWRNAPVATVKAFFIPKSDLLDLLSDSNCIGARGYLGFGSPDSNPAEAKLILVDVEGDITKGGTDNLSFGIYDFTAPCPTTCDVNSPLFIR